LRPAIVLNIALDIPDARFILGNFLPAGVMPAIII
jgi:hypothetical protein